MKKQAKAKTAKITNPADKQKKTRGTTPPRPKSEAKSAPAVDSGVFIATDDEPEAAPAPDWKGNAAKVEKKKRERAPDWERVELPAHITTPGGALINVTANAITIEDGLRSYIFRPADVYRVPKEVKEMGGKPLPEPIPAGTVALMRGEILRLIPHDSPAINAIMTANALAREAKRKEREAKRMAATAKPEAPAPVAPAPKPVAAKPANPANPSKAKAAKRPITRGRSARKSERKTAKN